MVDGLTVEFAHDLPSAKHTHLHHTNLSDKNRLPREREGGREGGRERGREQTEGTGQRTVTEGDETRERGITHNT